MLLKIGEHHQYNKLALEELASYSSWFEKLDKTVSYEHFFQRKRDSQNCYSIRCNQEEKWELNSSYVIGTDWVIENELAISIEPKLNTESREVDYLSMLFEALEEAENINHLEDLFTVDTNAPQIEIEQKDDKLTPFILIEYLQLLKHIVRKGLKKSYYSVSENLNSRVKGKVLVSQTIKKNHTQNKLLQNYCQYEEFGYNSLENKLLKKALVFCESVLSNFNNTTNFDFSDLLNFIKPAFSNVESNVELKQIKSLKSNRLFKEYDQAIALAKIILNKYGFNISNTTKNKAKTPPFWIDMTKLFELYVFKKLKEVFPNNSEVLYHKSFNRQEPDFILKSLDGKYKMVVDAKYKPRLENSDISMDDARQVSGYARLKSIYKEMNISDESKMIDCLIIYSNQNIEMNKSIERGHWLESKNYVGFYKQGIKLPELSY